VRKIKREKEEEEEAKRTAALIKQVNANQAFENWIRNRSKATLWGSENRLLGNSNVRIGTA